MLINPPSSRLILLIDHESHVREVVHACLSDLGGWNVLSVASAQEALEQLKTAQPSAILIDILIPENKDMSFLKTLRQNSQVKQIPIVILSSRAKWYTSQQLKQLGIQGAIAKPFDPVMLPRQFSKLLGWKEEFSAVKVSQSSVRQ